MAELHLQPVLRNADRAGVGSVVAATFPYTIGRRRECDLRVSDACVSREHCRLFLRGDHVWISDLGSLNGTFLNEEQVRESMPIHDGDVLRVAFSVFKVRVPDAADQTIMQEESRPPKALRQVLVVEDDENAAASLALVLKTWGCQVEVAHDGSEAVRSAREHPPDAVLLDLCLPEMDGYQVARRLRDEAGLVGARMVAMTGYAEAAGRRSPDDTGVQKLLLKPVGEAALRAVISGV
jgi:CheY-like chemotaxis protein